MALTIDFFNDQEQRFSPTSSKDIGKRVAIVGTRTMFDETGYADEEDSSINTSSYDYARTTVGSLSAMKSAFGKDNDLYRAYQSITYAGVNEVIVINVPYSRTVQSQTILSDREQFKLNMISVVQTLLERDDIDICVLCSINVKDDVDTVKTIVSSMTNKNILKLMIVNATAPDVEIDNSITGSIDSIMATQSDVLRNVCVVCNNGYYDIDKGPVPIANMDYEHIDAAAYSAGLVVASSLGHPSLKKTVYNSVKTTALDGRLSYFRLNKIRGVVLSNFRTLGAGADSKNTLSSAINVYRASIITADLTSRLKPLIGTPMQVDSRFGTQLYANETITSILDKYLSLEIISKYAFSTSINQLKMSMDVSIDLLMTYDLEAVKIHNVVGV